MAEVDICSFVTQKGELLSLDQGTVQEVLRGSQQLAKSHASALETYFPPGQTDLHMRHASSLTIVCKLTARDNCKRIGSCSVP
jgi:hypothetical protein